MQKPLLKVESLKVSNIQNILHSSLMQEKALALCVTHLHMLRIWVCVLTLSGYGYQVQ